MNYRYSNKKRKLTDLSYNLNKKKGNDKEKNKEEGSDDGRWENGSVYEVG